MMKMYKILTFMSLGLFACIVQSQAQSDRKSKTKPRSYNEIPGVLKIDTPLNINSFAIKPIFREHVGDPVEIPNAYRGSSLD
jgi:hypothetical protein